MAAAQMISHASIQLRDGREVPRVPTSLALTDRLATWRVRWGMGRMRFVVEPGLYAVGYPNRGSPVLVTANYKMSFNSLRSRLGGRDAWILVLDTKGINVWCAAGKGTFGTEELVRRIGIVRLTEVVEHRVLVVPQLGAVGVSAYEVRQVSGFRVRFGPVRAEDLPAYLDAGMKATPEMRQVRFALRDRIVLVPVELVGSAKYVILPVALFFILVGLDRAGFSISLEATAVPSSVITLLAAWLAGGALGPILLPWLPGRAFAVKGLWIGLLVSAGVALYGWHQPSVFAGRLSVVAWMLIAPSLTSFILMNFTGASTYTSLSGVRREMRIAVPLQLLFALVGAGMWLADRFV